MIPIVLPPRERSYEFVRRWFRSRSRFGDIRYWLLFQGIVTLVIMALIFVSNVAGNGWRNAYDVMAQITSPFDRSTSRPWLALPLALAGYLVVPSVVGALVGYVVVDTTNNRREAPPDPLIRGRLRRGSGYIPRLDTLLFKGHGHEVPRNFASYFVGLHEKDWIQGEQWAVAQDHWETLVTRLLDSDAIHKHATPHQAMRQAVSKTAAALLDLPQPQACPICSERWADPNRRRQR